MRLTCWVLLALVVPDELPLRNGLHGERVVHGHGDDVGLREPEDVGDAELEWEVTPGVVANLLTIHPD